VPPQRLVMMSATRFRNAAALLRSSVSSSANTFSNPRAREKPKSPSPTTESSAENWASFSTAVWAMQRTTRSSTGTAASALLM
jgi:hypothetical protein